MDQKITVTPADLRRTEADAYQRGARESGWREMALAALDVAAGLQGELARRDAVIASLREELRAKCSSLMNAYGVKTVPL